MDKWILSKTFRFESAHRLSKGYIGKCSRLHGHSWNGLVAVSGTVLDKTDMVFDLVDLGDILKLIEGLLDHRTILWRDDPLSQVLEEENPDQVVVMDDNPTSETIAKWIYTKVNRQLPENISVDYVEVNETIKCSCKYRFEPSKNKPFNV